MKTICIFRCAWAEYKSHLDLHVMSSCRYYLVAIKWRTMGNMRPLLLYKLYKLSTPAIFLVKLHVLSTESILKLVTLQWTLRVQSDIEVLKQSYSHFLISVILLCQTSAWHLQILLSSVSLIFMNITSSRGSYVDC